jgi:hypothetical protein
VQRVFNASSEIFTPHGEEPREAWRLEHRKSDLSDLRMLNWPILGKPEIGWPGRFAGSTGSGACILRDASLRDAPQDEEKGGAR